LAPCYGYFRRKLLFLATFTIIFYFFCSLLHFDYCTFTTHSLTHSLTHLLTHSLIP
jgi:hypothetical protein